MNGWALTLLIILVLGIIVSNIMLLKYSTKFKVPPKQQDENKKK